MFCILIVRTLENLENYILIVGILTDNQKCYHVEIIVPTVIISMILPFTIKGSRVSPTSPLLKYVGNLFCIFNCF